MNLIQDAIGEIDVMLPPNEYAREVIKFVCEKFGFSFAVVTGFGENVEQALLESYRLPDGFVACNRFCSGPGAGAGCPWHGKGESGQVEYIPAPKLSSQYPQLFSALEKFGVRGVACVPLVNRGRVLGSCTFFDDAERDRTGDDLAVLGRLGLLLAVAISNNRYFEQLRKKTAELERENVERRRAEKMLAEEKERVSVMLRSVGDGLIAADGELRVTMMNEAAERLTQWTSSEAAGRPMDEVFRIINQKDREVSESPVKKALKTGSVVGLVHESILIGRKGAEHFLSASCAPIRDSGGATTGVIVVFRDITDRKIMGEELIKASKLESIGILAGGIAHDFNNLLTGIIGNISFAKMLSNRDDKVFGILTKAEDVAFQAKDLTSQFRTFSKGGTPIRKAMQIGELVKTTAEFVVRGSKSRCVFEMDEALRPVEVDESQFGQVVTNLIINSIQAMPSGGVITIRLQNSEVGFDSVLALKPGKYVRITIVDNGVGISRENLQRIFDPYFTTKPKGTGLGLTTSYSIVRKHEGTITVESEVGAGTKFQIYLPASVQEAEMAPPAAEPVRSVRYRVLVMDDEAIVREVMMQLLSHLGYDVEMAKNGEETIELYKKSAEEGRRFDIAILDLVVPGGIGGAETMAELLRIDPKICAIASSGYSNEIVMSRFAQYGFKGVISKPYRIKELDELIQRVLVRSIVN